jgi:hypothetical protein
MARTFEFVLHGNLAEKLARILTAAPKSKVDFQGGLKRGTFSEGIYLLGIDMRIEGSYRVENTGLWLRSRRSHP